MSDDRDLTFHTLTYRLDLAGDADAMVRVSPDEHDNHRWLTASQARALPLVWHVASTLEAIEATEA